MFPEGLLGVRRTPPTHPAAVYPHRGTASRPAREAAGQRGLPGKVAWSGAVRARAGRVWAQWVNVTTLTPGQASGAAGPRVAGPQDGTSVTHRAAPGGRFTARGG